MSVVLRMKCYEEMAYRYELYGLALIRSSNKPHALDESMGIEIFFYSEVG